MTYCVAFHVTSLSGSHCGAPPAANDLRMNPFISHSEMCVSPSLLTLQMCVRQSVLCLPSNCKRLQSTTADTHRSGNTCLQMIPFQTQSYQSEILIYMARDDHGCIETAIIHAFRLCMPNGAHHMWVYLKPGGCLSSPSGAALGSGASAEPEMVWA